MIPTNGWDVLLIVVRYQEGRWEVRVGAGCLVIVVWLAIRIIRWLRHQAVAP